MHYEIQCLIACPKGRKTCEDDLIHMVREIETALRGKGMGYVIEANDLRAGRHLFQSVDAAEL